VPSSVKNCEEQTALDDAIRGSGCVTEAEVREYEDRRARISQLCAELIDNRKAAA
jgi:hypothetical protein